MEEDAVLPIGPEQISKMVAALETLHQRVLCLERIVVGLSVGATPEQRGVVHRMLDRVVEHYSPLDSTYPQFKTQNWDNFMTITENYRLLFSAAADAETKD